MKKIILILIGAAVFLFLLALAYFYLWPRDQGDVQLEFQAPNTVHVGEPFNLDVTYTNGGAKSVHDAKLIVTIPEGMSFIGRPAQTRFIEQTIGELGPGVLNKQTVTLIATGGSQSVKRIETKVTYGVGPSRAAEYESRGSVDVEVGQPSVVLSFDAPDKVFSGQVFSVVVNYENAADVDFKNLRLKLDYSPVFQFGKASSSPSSGNNAWTIPLLSRGQKGSITVTGSVIGPDTTFFQFKGTLSAELSGQIYAVATQEAAIGIALSPLSLDVKVNQAGPEYVSRAGDSLTYVLAYKNNSSVPLENVTISAILSGDMFDLGKARSKGFFNSLANTFTWNTANTPELRSIAPGVTAMVDLQIPLRDAFPITRIGDKNYTVKLDGRIESPTVPEQTGASKTVSVAHLENRIGGLLTIDALGYYRDAAAGIANAGPFPPKVNQATQYTIRWVLKNYSTDVTGVRVSAFLQSNTRFTGKVKSTLGGTPKFNPASGEVSWEIANLPATKGVLGDPVEAIFQIENTPAVNQIGRAVPLLSATKVEAMDTFTNRALVNDDAEMSTALPDDATVKNMDKSAQP